MSRSMHQILNSTQAHYNVYARITKMPQLQFRYYYVLIEFNFKTLINLRAIYRIQFFNYTFIRTVSFRVPRKFACVPEKRKNHLLKRNAYYLLLMCLITNFVSIFVIHQPVQLKQEN